MKRLPLIAAAVLAFTGADQSAPVRHLEYAFTVYPTALPSRGSFDGVLSIDILGSGPNGGTLIRGTETYYFAPRPEQARECEIFANGNYRCDDVPPFPSDSEYVIFPLLARDFFRGASPTAASSWQQKFSYSFAKGLYQWDYALDLSAAPQADGQTLLVTSKGTSAEVGGYRRKTADHGRIVYDPAAAVPILVHEVSAPIHANSIGSETAVDLQLMKDSNPASAPALRQLAPPHFSPP